MTDRRETIACPQCKVGELYVGGTSGGPKSKRSTQVYKCKSCDYLVGEAAVNKMKRLNKLMD